MAAEKPCTTSVTWEELENCTELNRSRSGNGVLINIEAGTPQHRNPGKAHYSVSRNQQVQILKRQPKSDPCLTATVSETVTSALDGTTTTTTLVTNRPIKTLEQREAAYAEARARILGSSGATSSPSPAYSEGNIKKKFPSNSTNYRKGASSESSNQRGNRNGQQQPAGNQINFRSTNQNYMTSDSANASYRVLT